MKKWRKLPYFWTTGWNRVIEDVKIAARNYGFRYMLYNVLEDRIYM